jgi:hypothetical protein
MKQSSFCSKINAKIVAMPPRRGFSRLRRDRNDAFLDVSRREKPNARGI